MESKIKNDRKNPFPRKAVVDLQGTTPSFLRTVPTPSFTKVASDATNYLNDGIGQAIMVSGAYGSGKTHLITYTMEAVSQAKENTETRAINNINVTPYVQIYVKARSDSIEELYKDIIKELGQDQLQNLNTSLLASLACKEIGLLDGGLLSMLPESEQSEVRERQKIARDSAVGKLRRDPSRVYAYLDELLLQPDEIRDAQSDMIAAVAGKNFKKAFQYLDDPRLSKVAYGWFALESLTETQLVRIGVSEPLSGADQVQYALRLLVTLFRHAEIPFLLHIDQVEKLLKDVPNQTLRENRGFLLSIAEFTAQESAFLLLVGSDDGWQHVTEDFWGRIGPARIFLTGMSETDSLNLIKLYLSESKQFVEYQKPEDIEPFTMDGVRATLRLSGGNFRRFLQTCHEAYSSFLDRHNLSTLINQNVIEKSLSNGVPLCNEITVGDEFRRAARHFNLEFHEDVKLPEGLTADFIIGNIKTPLAVVEVTDALFYDDEAKQALGIITQHKKLAKNYPEANLVVAVAGYASQEVIGHLENIVDRVLVFGKDGSKAELDLFLNNLAKHANEIRQAPSVDKEVLIASVKSELQSLFSTREKEVIQLNKRITGLIETQAKERRKRETEQGNFEWRSWVREERERFRQIRKDAAHKAQEEQNRLQQEGNHKRTQEAFRRGMLGGSCILMIAITLKFFPLFPTGSIPDIISRDFIILVSIAFSAFLYFPFIYFHLFPLGKLTNEITKYSGNLSNLILQAKTNEFIWARRSLLNDPSSIIRFVGAYAIYFTAKQRNKAQEINIKERIVTETWLPLYEAYLRILSINPQNIISLLNTLIEFNQDDPRIIHTLSFLGNLNKGSTPDNAVNTHDLSIYSNGSEKVLAHALFEKILTPTQVNYEKSILVQFALPFASESNPLKTGAYALGIRFLKGQPVLEDNVEEIQYAISEKDLDLLIEYFSPYEEGSLGSFLDLPINSLYHRIYEYLYEIRWRYERDQIQLSR